MKFYEWFVTFLEEKEIDLSDFLTEGIQVGDVAQGICDTSPQEQKAIKDILVKIDFQNGDVLHFFKHLAQAIPPEEARRRREQLFADPEMGRDMSLRDFKAELENM